MTAKFGTPLLDGVELHPQRARERVRRQNRGFMGHPYVRIILASILKLFVQLTKGDTHFLAAPSRFSIWSAMTLLIASQASSRFRLSGFFIVTITSYGSGKATVFLAIGFQKRLLRSSFAAVFAFTRSV